MRLPPKLSPLPRRHGLQIGPHAFLGLSCVLLKPFEHRHLEVHLRNRKCGIV